MAVTNSTDSESDYHTFVCCRPARCILLFPWWLLGTTARRFVVAGLGGVGLLRRRSCAGEVFGIPVRRCPRYRLRYSGDHCYFCRYGCGCVERRGLVSCAALGRHVSVGWMLG